MENIQNQDPFFKAHPYVVYSEGSSRYFSNIVCAARTVVCETFGILHDTILNVQYTFEDCKRVLDRQMH